MSKRASERFNEETDDVRGRRIEKHFSFLFFYSVSSFLPFRDTSLSHLSTFQSFALWPEALEVGGI